MTYTYDADGNRVKKASSSTGTLYWHSSVGVIAETDLSGATKSEYVFFGGKRIARIDAPANSLHYYLSDHLNSTSMIVSASGSVEEESDYSPYGSEYGVTAGPNHYKFTGRERDTETGLDYFGARYYTGPTGRFMSPDPANLSVDFWLPQTWNRYTYSLNNPLSMVDRNGLWPYYIHNEIIEESFPGMSKQDLKVLEDASWNMDFGKGQQDPVNSFEHGMSDATTNPPQDRTVAKGRADDYITEQVKAAQKAQAEWEASGHKGIAPAALTAFGNALHTTTDRTSPSHQGEQPWRNKPWYSQETRAHVSGELSITDAQMGDAINAARALYYRTFGRQFWWDHFLKEKVTHKFCDEKGKHCHS